jgi:hypothetical protein
MYSLRGRRGEGVGFCSVAVKKLQVLDTNISILSIEEKDYISLTDMLKANGNAEMTDCDMKARERRKQEKPFEMT